MMGRRCRFLCKAAISRLLFAVHGSIVCSWLYTVRDGDFSKYFGAPLLLLPIEMFITLFCTKHGEWKWFSPALLLYLLCVIPGIGFLHVDIYQRRMEKMGYPDVSECQDLVSNSSVFPEIRVEHVENEQIKKVLKEIDKIFKLTDWPEVLEQSTMFLVILGRWMLPKGNLTREQLSQLLLVYLGMAADILEFSSESSAQPVVACDLVKIGIVIGIWGMSLCQFTLVLTSVAGPKIRNFRGKKWKRGSNKTDDMNEDQALADIVEQQIEEKQLSICGSEIWSLLIVLLLQDCPFLAMRLYLIITIRVVDRAMLFFAGKNLLVFMLVTYRIIVLCGEHKGKTRVRPVPLIGIEQQTDVGVMRQSDVDAVVVRKQRPNWSIGPLLQRLTVLASYLRNQVREIASRREGQSTGSTSSMTPPVTITESHSLEVTEVDGVEDSVRPVTTETEITDTAKPLPCSDDSLTTAGKTKLNSVDETKATTLKPHPESQHVPSVVEVENDHENMTSVNDDIVRENLQTPTDNLPFAFDNDVEAKNNGGDL